MFKEKFTSKTNNKEHNNNSRESIAWNTSTDLWENLDMDKEKIKRQLENATNVEDRIKLFSKRSDSYGIEAIAWMIPGIWDLTPSIISTCYLLSEWIHIWLPLEDCLKILWYQTADFIIGSIPVIWDIADFFFKWNKYSAKIFSQHIEKLKQAAKEKWISQEEIDNIWKKEKRFIRTIDKYINRKNKKNNA